MMSLDAPVSYAVQALVRFVASELPKCSFAPSLPYLLNTINKLSRPRYNQAQRDRGGATVQEDESRYLVTLRRPRTAEVWSSEVIGHP